MKNLNVEFKNKKKSLNIYITKQQMGNTGNTRNKKEWSSKFMLFL